MEFNEEIMKKVEQKERRDNYVRRCLDVCICPKCGENLTRKALPYTNVVQFDCTSCKFKKVQWP